MTREFDDHASHECNRCGSSKRNRPKRGDSEQRLVHADELAPVNERHADDFQQEENTDREIPIGHTPTERNVARSLARTRLVRAGLRRLRLLGHDALLIRAASRRGRRDVQTVPTKVRHA
jgi:hypothetical protein